nr:MAG TPA: hypothetical protein [Bacteriophage sp.]DAK97238.1 MAG TPA: hypothetical protein [Caudoviricetes sp.]DAU94989.1 MAG TPA: hypothetical protein [Caudoviricetes sp.]
MLPYLVLAEKQLRITAFVLQSLSLLYKESFFYFFDG